MSIIIFRSKRCFGCCKWIRSAAGLVWLALTAVTLAQSVPPLVNYQGRLSNPDGSPLPTADYTLTFNLYGAATNGALVWGPQVFDGAAAQGHGARIPVVQGYFNVMLGQSDTLGRALSDAFNGSSRYVEVTVSNRPPIAPRQQILTTPFAFQAANSAKLAGYDWSALLGTNNPLAGTIPFSKMPQRQVGTNVGVGGVAISLSTGTNQWDSPAPTLRTAVTNLSVTLTTRGGPVLAILDNGGQIPDPDEASYVEVLATGSIATIHIQLVRNDGQFLSYRYRANQDTPAQVTLPPGVFRWLDTPAAGTHTFVIQVWGTAANRISFRNVRLVAFEL